MSVHSRYLKRSSALDSKPDSFEQIARLFRVRSDKTILILLMSAEISLIKSTCSYPPSMSMLSISAFMANSFNFTPTVFAKYLTSSVLPELEGPVSIKGNLCVIHLMAASKNGTLQ